MKSIETELADAFVLLWSSDDRAAWDKKAIEHFDTLLAKVERGSFITQQEIASHEYQARDGTWHGFLDQRHYESTVEDGSWPIRALYTAPPEATEGYVLVLREPTQEMLDFFIGSTNARGRFESMLDAAGEKK